jgi:hypothetical protein
MILIFAMKKLLMASFLKMFTFSDVATAGLLHVMTARQSEAQQSGQMGHIPWDVH